MGATPSAAPGVHRRATRDGVDVGARAAAARADQIHHQEQAQQDERAARALDVTARHRR